MATYITLPSLSANKVLTASYVNTLHDNLQVFSKHNHSGSAGEGSTSAVGASAASPFVHRHEIVCHIAPSSQGFTLVGQSTALFYGMQQTNANPASMQFPIGLVSGEYYIDLMRRTNATDGIASLLIGASVLAEIDNYSSGTDNNVIVRTNASIPTTGSYALTLRLDGKKNALASNSLMQFSSLKIRRTGNY